MVPQSRVLKRRVDKRIGVGVPKLVLVDDGWTSHLTTMLIPMIPPLGRYVPGLV